MNLWLIGRSTAARAVFTFTALTAASASAAEPVAPPPIAEQVPADAAVLLSLRLPEVEDGFAFADLLSGLYPQLAQAITAVRTPLALPAFSESELSDRGVVADRSTFLSLFRTPAKLPRTAKGFAHRLVVPISSREKFLTYVQGVLLRLKFSSTVVAAKAASWARPLARLAKKRAVALWAFDSTTAQGVSLRFVEHELDAFALIDVFVPDNPKPARTQTSAIFLAGIKATIDQDDITTLASVWNEGTRSALGGKASLVLVLQPTFLVPLLPTVCQTQFASDAGAFFSEAAITAQLNPFDWKMRVAFAPTAIAKPLVLKGGNNDGLIDTRALADAGLGAASLFLDDAAPWLKVPRPAVLGKSWADTATQWQACGVASMAISLTRFWPHMITGLFTETLDSLQAPSILAAARNLAVGLRSAVQPESVAPPTPCTLWMASLQSDQQALVYKWLDGRAEGPAENAAFGSRSPRLWTLGGNAGPGVMKSAGVETLPGPRIGLALSPEETGLGWYYSEKRRPAVFSNRAALGTLHINIKRLLSVAAETASVDTRDAVLLATSQISRIGGDLTSNGSLLELNLSLSGGGI